MSGTGATVIAERSWATLAPVSRRTRALGFMRRLIRTSPMGAAAGAVLLGICLVGAFAEVIAPYDPLAANFAATRREPSAQYLLGTDYLGRDVLSRIIHGARVTLLVAVTSESVNESGT